MNHSIDLTRLGEQEPAAVAALVDALWKQLEHDDPALFEALRARAKRRSPVHHAA